MSTVPGARWRVVDVDGMRDVYDAVFGEVYRYAARLRRRDGEPLHRGWRQLRSWASSPSLRP